MIDAIWDRCDVEQKIVWLVNKSHCSEPIRLQGSPVISKWIIIVQRALSQPSLSCFLKPPITYRKTLRRKPWRLTAFKCPSDVMLEIPSLPLKYSELRNDRRQGIRFRCMSVLQRVKENYCTETRTNSRYLFKGGTQSALDVCRG